jgi:hypothetical protein
MVNSANKLSLIFGLLLVIPFLTSCIGATPTPGTPPLPPSNPTSTYLPSTDVVSTGTATLPILPQAQHRIAIRQIGGQAEFYDKSSNNTFTPRGANYVYIPFNGTITNLPLKVGTYDPQRTRDDFTKLAGMGYNTVRVFLDACSSGPGCIATPEKSGLNPNYLDNIADMMIAAKEAGIYILFTSNDLPDDGGYSEEANQGSGGNFAGYRNSYYLRPQAISATRRYWSDLLNGLTERNAAFDSVLGWQLLNEQWMFRDQPPLSLTNGIVTTTTGSYNMSISQQKEQMVSDGIIYYIAQMKEEILAHDPTALVTMGFFVPELVAPGWYVETRSLLEKSELDFFDFHAYPGSLSLQAHVEAFGMLEYSAKPIILGEYGAFTHSYAELKPAARALTNWVAESCQFGFDGWLFWAYYSASSSTGDRTWGMVDNDDYLLNLFSPENQPNPCVPIEIPSENLAYNKPVIASHSLTEEPPKFAVDDVADTQWGSGADPQQWIEVDLENSYQINEIKLLVAQWPEGNTIHRVQVRKSKADSYITVHEFSGITKDNQWLTFITDKPIENVRYIRIQTITSPSWVSWKEISVKGELAP